MMIDVEGLLEPVSEDNPVGEDLDGSPGRYAIEEPFQQEQQVEDGEEADIDWRGAANRIAEQFGQTKDLWLAVYLMRAGARMGDLDVVLGGAQLGAGMLERYWDTVHPQLEQVDFIGRKAPFESLTKLRDFLNPLKQVILVQHPRSGRYSIADVQRFALEGEGADGFGMFQAALNDIPAGELQGVRDKVDGVATAIRQADAVLTANAVGDTSTNFEPTYRALTEISDALDAFAVAEPADDEIDLSGFDIDLAAGEAGGGELDLDGLDLDGLDLDGLDLSGLEGDGDGSLDLSDLDSLLLDDGAGATPADAADEPAPRPATPRPVARAGARRIGSGGGGGGAITSRADAVAALEAVEAYFKKHEPSNPIPSIIQRARKWVDMDFMTLLEDLSPDSMSEARKVFGIRDGGYGGGY